MVKDNPMNGIPVLHAEGDCVARAWENALIELHKNGCRIKTEYDKPEDPPSIDATMLITIHDPTKEPVIHKDFPGGPEDLQEYTMEVCEGIKDHLVRRADDPEEEKKPLPISRPYAIALVVLAAGIILIGTIFGPWFHWAGLAAGSLF